MPAYFRAKDALIQQFGTPDEQDETIDPTADNHVVIEAIRDSSNALFLTWKFKRPGGSVPDAIILYTMKGSLIDIDYLNGDLALIDVRRHKSRKP
jgi:hypothetical protein